MAKIQKTKSHDRARRHHLRKKLKKGFAMRRIDRDQRQQRRDDKPDMR